MKVSHQIGVSILRQTSSCYRCREDSPSENHVKTWLTELSTPLNVASDWKRVRSTGCLIILTILAFIIPFNRYDAIVKSDIHVLGVVTKDFPFVFAASP